MPVMLAMPWFHVRSLVVMPFIVIIPHFVLIFYQFQDCVAESNENIVRMRTSPDSNDQSWWQDFLEWKGCPINSRKGLFFTHPARILCINFALKRVQLQDKQGTSPYSYP